VHSINGKTGELDFVKLEQKNCCAPKEDEKTSYRWGEKIYTPHG
jgi:hypothetical protein